MGAPQCKVCGVSHWSHEPHVWPVTNVRERARERQARWRAANRERYNARQRELMRRRRAVI